MYKFVIYLASVISLAFSQCVPAGKSNFYWKTPCDGQTFTNQLIVTNVVATQNGQSIDSQGGIDATVNLTALMTFTDNYGKTVTTPLIDMAFQQYIKGITGNCNWVDVPTFGFSDNMDACQVMDNCHLSNPPNPTSATVVVNIASIARKYVGALSVDTYYGISMTYKDDKTNKLGCVYIQDKLIKV